VTSFLFNFLQIYLSDHHHSSLHELSFAAFLGLHVTSAAFAYIEGFWLWLGDHDLDNGQMSVFSGRGILSESQGPT
jgi:hypothetical protein